MKRMGKISTVLFAALFAVMILMPMVNQAHAYVLQWMWSDYVYKGYDNYYGSYIIAYLNGTTVKLKVPVYNDVSWMGPSINITEVSLMFDTGWVAQNLTSVVNATLYETKYFDFSFAIDTNKLSNLWAHTYTIYVDLQDNGGTKYDNYWVISWNYYTSYRFVVYLPEQKDVMDLSMKYSSYYNNYPPYNFQTIGARMLATQAGLEATLAQNSVNLGNFTEAKTHYQTAVSKYEEAFAAEEDKGVAIEDAELNATIKEGNAAEKTADAAMLNAQGIMNQSYGYILLGLGFLLIGVGAILYGVKKPKAS